MGPRVGQWSGWIYKQGSRVKTWKRRYMVLQGRHITYYDKSVLDPNPTEKGALVLYDVTQNFAIANGLFLHDNKGKQMKIYTDTTVEFQDCFFSMQRACKGDGPPTIQQTRQMNNVPEPIQLVRPVRAASERHQPGQRFALPERAVSERMGRMDLASPVRSTERRSSDCQRGSSRDSQNSIDSHTPTPKLLKSIPQEKEKRTKEILRGWLYKEGQHIRNWKRRYFILTGDHLAYYGKQGETSKGEGRVMEVAINPQKSFGLLIRLDSDRILRVAGESEDEMERWHSAIRSALKNQEYLERRISSSIRYSGYLTKKGSSIKTWHRRWFILQGLNQLGYCDKEGDTPKGYGKVLDVCVNHKKPYCLYIHLDTGRRLSVAGENQNDIDGWFHVLTQVAAAVAQTQQNKESIAHTNHKGWLQKEGNSFKNWKRRYFTLHGRTLVYHKEIGGNPVGQGIVQGVTEGISRPFAIDIHFETGRVLRVAANSERDRTTWMTVLNRAIQEKVELNQTMPSAGKPLLRQSQTTIMTEEIENQPRDGPMEGWLEWEGARTFFTLNGREMKYFANPNGLVLGKGTLKDMRVENFRDFIMHIVFMNSNPIRVKAESNEELNAWRNAVTLAVKGQLVKDVVYEKEEIKKGWMLKEGKKIKNWKRRYFVLKGTDLFYYKNEKMEKILGQGSIVHVKPNQEKESSLVIIMDNGRLLVVALNSDQEESMWLRSFQSALQNALVPTPILSAPLRTVEHVSISNSEDEYDEFDDDIYTTNISYVSKCDTDIYQSEISLDFDHDDEDDLEESDAESISSDEENEKPNYDSDGLSSLSSLSDFED